MKKKPSNSKSLPPLLRECWNRLNSTFMKRVKQVGLTPDQYTVLRWIHELPTGTVSQSQLASLMSTDANNIAGLIKRMSGLRLIDRKKNPLDKRQNLIFPTDDGDKLFKKGKKIAEKLEKDSLACFTDDEKDHFLCLLEQLTIKINNETAIDP
jgi:MarR family transcriptional regulator, transcriptional regulator for hemolysin